MRSASALQLRFHNWAVIALLCFMGAITASILVAVNSKFESIASDHAGQNLQLVMQNTLERLTHLVDGACRDVALEAGAGRHFFIHGEGINDRDMEKTFLLRLSGEESLYSLYFGLDNDDFFQVINTGGNPGLAASLAAPPETRFALRVISRTPEGKRIERWRFLSAGRKVLGSQKTQTSYFPTKRPWYRQAVQTSSVAMTPPYLFASSGEAGLTVSSVLEGGRGVLGADLSLASLQTFLAKIPLTPGGAIVVSDRDNRILALYSKFADYRFAEIPALEVLSRAGNPQLAVLGAWPAKAGETTPRIVDIKGDAFVFARSDYTAASGALFRIGVFAPLGDYSASILEARNRILYVTLVFLLILIPLAVFGARRVGRSLATLAGDARRISRLDFSGDVGRLPTILQEVDVLGQAHAIMKDTIRKRTRALMDAEHKLASLVEDGILLTKERDRQQLLRHILHSGRQLCNCDAGTIYLKTNSNTLSFALRTKDDKLPQTEIPLADPLTGEPNERYVSAYAALHNETVVIDDVYAETRFDLSHRYDEKTGYKTRSLLTVPISPREGEVIGVLQFMNALDPDDGGVIPFRNELVGFVEALASQAAVALENHQLLEAQQALMDALIQLVASAIDAKSHYAGGHCERVPQLAILLAEEAARVQEGPLAAFGLFTEEEWREFRVGAWLHDCGKVTTPEFVVDKAAKLETLYNRIHEVRTRFEVLLRDAEITRLESLQNGEAADEADRRCCERRRQLTEDFAFVARCNIGGEFMPPADIARLRRIAGETWLRHFDDRLGLSEEEKQRFERTPVAPLPAVEHLLADKPGHIVERSGAQEVDPRHGFQMEAPRHLYNFGEVYNLSIERGTLTEEERFKIREHIIQTVVLLNALPFPRELRRVPEYAGAHHEALDGSGYPRGLSKDDLSLPARIIAIADIFEALTASDRPYKKAKTLSQAIDILYVLKKGGQIDPDLFDLFLRSGVYLRYAERYLAPGQIDRVDVGRYLD